MSWVSPFSPHPLLVLPILGFIVTLKSLDVQSCRSFIFKVRRQCWVKHSKREWKAWAFANYNRDLLLPLSSSSSSTSLPPFLLWIPIYTFRGYHLVKQRSQFRNAGVLSHVKKNSSYTHFVIHGIYIYKEIIFQFFAIPAPNCVLNAGKPSGKKFSSNFFVHHSISPRSRVCLTIFTF